MKYQLLSMSSEKCIVNVNYKFCGILSGYVLFAKVPFRRFTYQTVKNSTTHITFGGKLIQAVARDFQQCGMCDQQSLRSACAYAQSDQSLCLSLEYSMSVKLLTKHHLEFLRLKRGCTGWSEPTLEKMHQCWKSHVTAHFNYTTHQDVASASIHGLKNEML